MPGINAPIMSLNAGQVSKRALARVDLAKLRMAMELQENMLPTVLGPAEFRPGTAFQTNSRDNLQSRLIPFVFSASVTAELEFTDQSMRVLLAGQPLSRPAVSCATTNGDFFTDILGWDSLDESGASSAWHSDDGGSLELIGTGTNAAGRGQDVSTGSPGVEHAIRVVVHRGPVVFYVGTEPGFDDYIARTTLRQGTHIIAFTPSGDFRVEVLSFTDIPCYVSSIQIETAGGVMEAPTPWPVSALRQIRYAQSGDVLFCACTGYRQQRIERRSQRSWSIVDYIVDDGPFLSPNITATQISSSGTAGSVTLTATRPVFRTGHVGGLIRIDATGQSATALLSGDNQFTDPIRVSGLTADRGFTIDVSGTWSGTLKVQRSFGEPGAWIDYAPPDTGGWPGGVPPPAEFTANGSTNFNDALDNEIIYYRVGFEAGDYTSGDAQIHLSYGGGAQSGIVRVNTYTSATEVSGVVMRQLGNTDPTVNWAESAWSDLMGWPRAVAFFDGRLWWAQSDMLYGSISDAFESFDEEVQGDSGTIARSVATGGFDGILWILDLQRLLAGTGGQEISIRSSALDEPLTPSQFTARAISTRGAADVGAVKVDANGVYVQRNGFRVLGLSIDSQSQDYRSNDLTRVCEDICEAGVVEFVVQREPETRIWAVLADGTCAVLTYEPADEVMAWTRVIVGGGGAVESMCVTPGDEGDRVTFSVRRSISGSDQRHIETLSMPSECVGGTLSKNVDSHVVYEGDATTTISGLDHLEGQQVVVWADGRALVPIASPLTVSGGSITLPSSVSNAVVGLWYNWRLKSTKLAYAARPGSSALLQRKRVTGLGIVAVDIGWKGVKFGRDFTNMRSLSATYKGKTLDPDATMAEYDQDMSGFPGGWDTDSRFCMMGDAPYPATIMGIVVGVESNERGASAPSPPSQGS